MTARIPPQDIPPRCLCSHSRWRHLANSGPCHSTICGCTTYRPKETAK